MTTIGTCHIMMNFRNIMLSERRQIQKHTLLCYPIYIMASLIAQLVKNLPAMQETPVPIPPSERSAGEGIGYPLQYSWAFLVFSW